MSHKECHSSSMIDEKQVYIYLKKSTGNYAPIIVVYGAETAGQAINCRQRAYSVQCVNWRFFLVCTLVQEDNMGNSRTYLFLTAPPCTGQATVSSTHYSSCEYVSEV